MTKYPFKLFGDLIQQDDINHACLSIFLETTDPKTHEQVKHQILQNQKLRELIEKDLISGHPRIRKILEESKK